MEKPLKLHRNVPLLFCIRICRAFVVNLIWTTWPLFVRSLGANVYETSLVWAMGGLMNVILAIPLSLFSDRFGRKSAIFLTFIFSAVAHFGYTFVGDWAQLIPLKMIADIAWVLFMPAETAMIADISISAQRGRVYGIVGVAHPIGSIIAPLVGGLILDSYGWNAVFYSIVLSAVIGMVPCLFLTETVVKRSKEEMATITSFDHKSFKDRIDGQFLYPMLIFAFFNFFSGIRMGMSQITPIYLEERFNATSLQQGLFFSVGTMVPWLGMNVIGGWFADKYSRKKIVLYSAISWPILVCLWPSMGSYEGLLLLQVVSNAINHFSMPAKQAFLMDYTDESRRGLASGISMVGQRLGGTVLGTSLLGYLYEAYGQTIPFYAAALFVLPAIPIFMLLKERKKKTGS